jgi:hypothetical protein
MEAELRQHVGGLRPYQPKPIRLLTWVRIAQQRGHRPTRAELNIRTWPEPALPISLR